MLNDKIRINFEFEGTLEQLESAIMRIAMHPAEKRTEQTERTKTIKTDEVKPVAAPAAQAPKGKAPAQSKYARAVTIEQVKAAIAKHCPGTIADAVIAITEEYKCTGTAIGRLMNLNSYDMCQASRGNTPPKILKAFADMLDFHPITGQEELTVDLLKKLITIFKPAGIPELLTELKKNYSLVSISKLMNCTSESLIAAEKGEVAPLLTKVFIARLGFPFPVAKQS